MRVVVITSCTSKKLVSDPSELTLEDFRAGRQHVRSREKSLLAKLTPAESMYQGEQHLRLMDGVRYFRWYAELRGNSLDMYVLSAGYGLVEGHRPLAPYNATFPPSAIKRREWAHHLGVPATFRRVLSKPYDVAIILLGESYLDACGLASDLLLGGPTLLFCGSQAAASIPRVPQLRPVPLDEEVDTRRFRAGNVALKGAVGGRLLRALVDKPERILKSFKRPASLLKHLAPLELRPADPRRDRIIEISRAWKEQSSSRRVQYFIPDWRDFVDPDFDFQSDKRSFDDDGHWGNQEYAHQLFGEPQYDGILLSRSSATGETLELLERHGAHRMFRLPDKDFPIFGDCGAFDYRKEPAPPFVTEDVLDYYQRYGFKLGVSVDHMIIGQSPEDDRRRYELTLRNARAFIEGHHSRGYKWTPIGSVQGWSPESYAEAAAEMTNQMGYEYLALGSLVMKSDDEVAAIVRAVRSAIPPETRIHLFGVARIDTFEDYCGVPLQAPEDRERPWDPSLNGLVQSVDSASFLRKAWEDRTQNYFIADEEGGVKSYMAVRIPLASKHEKNVVAKRKATARQLFALESECLAAMRSLDDGRLTPEATLEKIVEYEALVDPEDNPRRKKLLDTLRDKPWQRCKCPICRSAKVDVIIFRRNDRNRRRGFHNTHVLYKVVGRNPRPGLGQMLHLR